MKKSLKVLTLSLLLSILSFFVLIKNISNSDSISFSKPFQGETNKLHGKYPTGLSIAELGIWLPVNPGVVQDDRWPTSSNSLIYLSGSGKIGEKGNIVIYGHNWPSLLGKIFSTNTGQIIELYAGDGQYLYEVFHIQEVSPNDVGIIQSSKDERLTLYTCSGLFDEKRFVVIAKRV